MFDCRVLDSFRMPQKQETCEHNKWTYLSHPSVSSTISQTCLCTRTICIISQFLETCRNTSVSTLVLEADTYQICNWGNISCHRFIQTFWLSSWLVAEIIISLITKIYCKYFLFSQHHVITISDRSFSGGMFTLNRINKDKRSVSK